MLSLTLSVGPNVRVRAIEPISALPYLRRPKAVEMSKGNTSNSNETLKSGVEANLRGGVLGGSWRNGVSLVRGGGRPEHGCQAEGHANRSQVCDGPKAAELHGEGVRARAASAGDGSRGWSGEQARASAAGAVVSTRSRGKHGRARWGLTGRARPLEG